MIRLICFLKRKTGLSAEAFQDHWRNRHGPLVAKTRDFARHIVRYEQNHRLAKDYEREDGGGFDGVTVQWFESPREFLAMSREASYREKIFVDEETFLDRPSLRFVLTEEPQVVIEGGGSRNDAQAKLLVLMRRAEGSTPDAFRKHWHEIHGPLLAGDESLARHVSGYDQHRRLDRDYQRDAGGGFDGVADLWFPKVSEFVGLAREPAYAAKLIADEERFLDRDSLRFVVCGAPAVVLG